MSKIQLPHKAYYWCEIKNVPRKISKDLADFNLVDYDMSNVLCGFVKRGYELERKKLTSITEMCKYDVYVTTANHIETICPGFYGVEDYPFEIYDYLKRIPSQHSWGHLLKCETGRHFVKPVEKGKFAPFVSEFPLMKHLDMLGYLHVSENAECWVQDPFTILTEWRTFVLDGEILDIRNYAGDPFLQPSRKFVQAAINKLPYEQPYILDVGICKEKGEFVIELNESVGFGTYGLCPIDASKLYLERWLRLYSKYGQKEAINEKGNEEESKQMGAKSFVGQRG